MRYSPTANSVGHGEVAGICGAGLSLGTNVLSHQSVYGKMIEEELSKYNVESKFDSGTEYVFSAQVPVEKWNQKTAIRLSIRIADVAWKEDLDPVRTLGKTDLSPNDFGYLLPLLK